MSAPAYVPVPRSSRASGYESPPRLGTTWRAGRPGEVVGGPQPAGDLRGYQGPDLGYALLLAAQLSEQLVLAAGESDEDVLAGCAAVAMRRAALFGRAPILEDLKIAIAIWGFGSEPSDDLVTIRRPLFEGIASRHHWVELRHVAEAVSTELLLGGCPPGADEVSRWRRELSVMGARA